MSKDTKVIAIADVKGGVGKTTTTMNIAALLARRGYPVTVLDSDNTGGATLWLKYVIAQNKQLQAEAAKKGETVPEYKLNFNVVPANLPQLDADWIRNQYDGWVLIDTPPSDNNMIRAAIVACDLAIIPCQPSVSDLTHAAITFKDSLGKGVILLTRVKTNTRSAKEAIASLDAQQIPQFETVIREREFIRNMYGTNQIDNQDYASVTQELIDYMNTVDNKGGAQ